MSLPSPPWGRSVWVTVGFALASGALAMKALRSRRQLPLPPGPKGLPLIGNVLQLPSEEPWKVYLDWAEQYGDLVYLEALGQPILVINSLPTINALLSRRAQNYSHRVYSPIIELMGHSWAVTLTNYGQRWRDQRRIFHRFFNPTKVHQFRPVIEGEIPVFLKRLADDPTRFRHWVHMYFGTVIMRVAYGSEDRAYNEGLINDADTAILGMMESLLPGNMLVGLFSPLRYVPSWFPGAGWKRKLERLAEMNQDLRTRPFQDAKDRIAQGTASNAAVSFATELVRDLPDSGTPEHAHDEELAQSATAISYLVGADTTGSSALAVFLALAMYPDIQRKAQAQIDEVVGADRLPTFDDLERLPYIQAFVKEIGRWHSVTPLALPHVSDKEDIFNGYRIPASTMILPNTWAVMHDPNIFDSPMEFRPERYLDKSGKLDPSVLDPEAAAFGYGRRICPGRHFSTESLALMALNVLASFDVQPATDEAGQPIPLSLSVTPTVTSTPKPFQCQIKPRSQQHSSLIRALHDS
ncbi:cytochrome P450 [Coprinopsis sp. MPI-PUGE-AT-0042]|nr:cytochrome P450 [Coprinopsis sp. MPI-PUGE-AT-0042]